MTAGPGTNPYNPVPHGTAATFGIVGAKTYTQAEGSKTAKGTQRGERPYYTLQENAEAGFLDSTI